MTGTLILIIEDNPRDLKLVRELLQVNGFHTIEATTGEAGIELARERTPALILMDIQLPQMSGREAAEILKSDSKTRHIPIVALTASAMKGDRERLLAEGFNGYIAKPINIKEIPGIVGSYLAQA
jgi:two-component system, cell cycle response regulator DivK